MDTSQWLSILGMAAGEGGDSGNQWMTLFIYFGFFIVVFYLLIIRPRKQQEKKHNLMMEDLKRGDKIVTIGGIKGEISKVKEESIMLKVSDNVEMEFIKKAIAHKVDVE